MAQIFSQIDHDPDSFTLTGASSATAVQAARALVVNYSGGSSDTIPIHTVAVLPDNVTTTFDRSLAVWVIYTVPGSGLLYAILESQVAGLTGDFAPLIRIMRHDWDWYQPMQPSGAAIQSGAWSGGAFIGVGRALRGGGYYGLFDSHSIQGGGSVSGVTIGLSNDAAGAFAGAYLTKFGFYFKVSTLPASDMILLDLYAGSSGYFRAKLTSAGHVVSEGLYNARVVATDLTPTTPVVAGGWYWVSAVFGVYSAFNGPVEIDGQVWDSIGNTDGRRTNDSGGGGSAGSFGTYTATLGWGVHQSASYLDFPGSAGNELSKLMLTYFTGGSSAYRPDQQPLFAPLSADPSPSGLEALYLCRQTVGSVSTLTDSTSNNFDLTAGANGLTIVADGPYA